MPRPSKYEFLDYHELPETVWDEVMDQVPSNGSGVIINPEYHPLLKAWLIENGHEVKCYILWASW